MPERIAIVGASSGIGREIALQLASSDRHIYLLARRKGLLDELVEDIENLGGSAEARIIDLSVPLAYVGFHDFLVKRNEQLDVVYHCAARLSMGPTHSHTASDWEEITQVNLLSVADLLATTYPEMISRGSGKIMLLSSVAGISGFPCSAPYSATKAGILGAFRSLQHEAKGSGVSLMVTCPGFIDTPLFENAIRRDVTLSQVQESVKALRLPVTPVTKAARQIVRQVERGSPWRVFPLTSRALVFLCNRIPYVTKPFYRKIIRILG